MLLRFHLKVAWHDFTLNGKIMLVIENHEPLPSTSVFAEHRPVLVSLTLKYPALMTFIHILRAQSG